MLYILRLFIVNLGIHLAVLFLGLFLVIFFTKNGAALDEIEKYKYLFLVCGLVVFIERLIYYIRYYRFHILPYSLKLFNRVNDEQKESKIYLDKFKKYDKKSNTYFFKNRLAIDKKAYLDLKDRIIHLLGYENKDEVEFEIKAYNKKEVAIKLFKLPKKFNWHIGLLKDKNIYLGHNKDGSYYLPLENLTSSICCGESGSGKSNFLNMIIFSLLHNSQYIEHLYFIDLKGVELSRYELNNTTFTDNIEEVNILLENLKNEMNIRFKQMKEKKDLTYDGNFRICLIDEIGTISTHFDKKLKENIFNNLIEIGQKGRASKVLLLIFSQKIDSTNIPTNVLTNLQSSFLLRTSSQFNINNTIGLNEEVKEITRIRVQDFPKGRVIFKDGLSSQKVLLQTPYLAQNIQNSMIKYFQSWINK
ncbi:FtsK/SpoIIIE domain-containing protein [Aliarcobacter cryaerophilus]|uniref:FtsK/SpoIIIE domain-containing protein n=1 Tax=Aliarcobacter cryaerophilus TaxID=28198 RepID=UPI0021B193C4|nr:FtsK/SpoIIIE domain-containing protein [Aliarcobacter cryaerophilus]MCT7488112.1 FtsK/SpoIIIE domain-containing protein [Aliarcobacter cryaerophilus]